MDIKANSLTHYASANYDPAAAHEYYLKNRELTGRKSTKGMSDTQKQALAYTKHKLGNDKKAELETMQANQKARLEDLRQKAEATKDRIQEKLKQLLESIKVKPLEKIEAEPVPVPSLIDIPPNASPKVQAYLQRQNGLRINKYNKAVDASERAATVKRKAASEAHSVAREKAAVDSEAARVSSRDERVRVGTELKTAVSNARTAYDEAKKQIAAKYEAANDTEFKNISTQLPSAPPPVKKAKAAPKPKAAKKAKEEVQHGDYV